MSAFLRKYGVATHVYLPLIKRGVVDFAVGADWTPAAGDVKVSIDGGAAASIGTLPAAVVMGNTAFWDFTLALGEVTGKKVVVTVADAATKAIEDQSFLIETYGNASAEYQADLSAANLPANVTQLLGTAWLTPGVAGTPDVNAKLIGGTSQTARDLGATLGVAGAGLTALGDTRIANLDAAVSTRSTYAGGDTAGTTTLLSRLTAARAGYLDVLNGIVAAIWAAVADSAGVTTLLARLTSGRAANLDNLDAAISSRGTGDATAANQTTINSNVLTRLPTSSYTAPDNASITAIKEKTDHLPSLDIVHTLGKLWVLDGDGNAVASAAAVDALPTNTELATALGTADDAVLAAIAALNNLSSSGAQSAAAAALTAYGAALQSEVQKIPRLGSTYRHHNVDTDVTADVLIEAVP